MNNKGSTSILLVLIMAVLLTALSYVVDIGIAYAEKIKLSNAVDSAVLAASGDLHISKEESIETAKEYLNLNYNGEFNYEIIISEDLKSVEIIANTTINHFFAQIFGNSSAVINSRSKAIIAPISNVLSGIKPLAVQNFNYSYGEVITLKEGASDGINGNFGAIALGGRGAANFTDNLRNGYDSKIAIGDELTTEPGNMMSALIHIKNEINSDINTFDNYDDNSLRLWTLPLIDSFDVLGRDFVVVVGFAEFFVEDIEITNGKSEINGRFIKYVLNGDMEEGTVDKGVYGIKLIK